MELDMTLSTRSLCKLDEGFFFNRVLDFLMPDGLSMQNEYR